MAIKVTHEPRKEVIIHEMAIHDTPEQLIKTIATGAPPGAILVLKWTSGVLISFTAFPLGGDSTVSKELIEGRLHWDYVACAPLPKFTERLSINNLDVRIADVSSNETFQAIGSFLKNAINSKKAKK